jgi:hypothetical protein
MQRMQLSEVSFMNKHRCAFPSAMIYFFFWLAGPSLQLKEPAQLLQLHNYFGNFMNAIPKLFMAWTKLQMQLTIR